MELEASGSSDIITQVLKSFEDTCRLPEQELLPVLVVIEVLSIDSEKVIEMSELAATELAESAGEVEETVGADESVSLSVVVSDSRSVLFLLIFEFLKSFCSAQVVRASPSVSMNAR